ncbi:hypothetical protein PG991_009370 [Apiospora marii]|uniref:Uncharacterized protein n=1 Tax=Apiospora marii TaxID=335849 RepID=A0ABR1RLI2_9PEZI
MGSPEWSTPELSTRMRDLAASPFKALNSLTRCFRPLATMSPSLQHRDWLRSGTVSGVPKPSSV